MSRRNEFLTSLIVHVYDSNFVLSLNFSVSRARDKQSCQETDRMNQHHINPTEDADLAARYVAWDGWSVEAAARAFGVTAKRLRGALQRTGTPRKERAEAKPAYTPVEREPWPLPAGHPTTWGAIMPGEVYPHV